LCCSWPIYTMRCPSVTIDGTHNRSYSCGNYTISRGPVPPSHPPHLSSHPIFNAKANYMYRFLLIAFLSIVLELPRMRALKYVVGRLCSLKCVAAFLYLQFFYVAAYRELKEWGRGGVEGDDPTVLSTGEGERERGEYQGPLEFDSTGEGRDGYGGDGGTPSPLDSYFPPRGEEVLPPRASTPPSPSSATGLSDSDTPTAPAHALTLTRGPLSHER
jgi:hypothetical protein